MTIDIHQIPVLRDNYVYLVRDRASGIVGVVDPALARPVLDALAERRWRLGFVLNTHHHADHTGGNLELKQATDCRIVGSKADAARIPGIDVGLADGDVFNLGQSMARVIEVPGHTRAHIAYWFESASALFCGDTLFALGCGRLFEGTAGQMWSSLSRLAGLPPQTRVYCAHEYTQANARFALSIEPGNAALQARSQDIDRMRAANRPTVPSTLAEERATNPFLRPDSAEIQRAVDLAGRPLAEVFGEIRRRKDHF